MRTGFSLILFIMVFASACQEDKECVPPPLAKHIVNNWNAKLISEKDKAQELTFENDGSFKESKGLIFGAAGNPVCSWEVDGEAVILNGKFSNGAAEQYECSVISRTCDQIVLSIDGIDQLELNKK
jgi:hypothetical protein